MQNSRAVPATPVVVASATLKWQPSRIAAALLLTLFDAAVIASFDPTLFAAASGHVLYLLGLILLTAALLVTLARSWFLLLRAPKI